MIEELYNNLHEAGDYLLTITGPSTPYLTENIEIDEIHKYLNWINVMTYDFHACWERAADANAITNFNSPLYFAKDDPHLDPYLNVEAAIKKYLDCNVPKDKICVGHFMGGAMEVQALTI